jgi:hypothetical protein
VLLRARSHGAGRCCLVVGVAGLEPATYGLEGRCSIQMSYTPVRASHRSVRLFLLAAQVTVQFLVSRVHRDPHVFDLWSLGYAFAPEFAQCFVRKCQCRSKASVSRSPSLQHRNMLGHSVGFCGVNLKKWPIFRNDISLEGKCSIHLSYGTTRFHVIRW